MSLIKKDEIELMSFCDLTITVLKGILNKFTSCPVRYIGLNSFDFKQYNSVV